jgi:hypothetical protein
VKATELLNDLQEAVAKNPDVEVYLHDGDLHFKPETCDLQCEEWESDVSSGHPFSGACAEFEEFDRESGFCVNCDHDLACHAKPGGGE